MGDDLIGPRDRRGRELRLAMTHEELVADLLRPLLRSRRQLSLALLQIAAKVRDEPRPRGGLLRLREFTMKDAYSFHADRDDFGRFYAQLLEIYARCFDRRDLDAFTVESDPGTKGGSRAHEFMVASDQGDALLVAACNASYGDLWGLRESSEPLTLAHLEELRAYHPDAYHPDAYHPDGTLLIVDPDGESAGIVSTGVGPKTLAVDAPASPLRYRQLELQRPLIAAAVRRLRSVGERGIVLHSWGDPPRPTSSTAASASRSSATSSSTCWGAARPRGSVFRRLAGPEALCYALPARSLPPPTGLRRSGRPPLDPTSYRPPECYLL